MSATLRQIQALLGQGRLDEAFADATAWSKASPDAAAAHLAVAQVLCLKGRPIEGIDAAARAVELAPEHRQSRIQLGHAQLLASRPDEAEQTYTDALAIWPGDAELVGLMGELFAIQRRADEAETLLTPHLDDDPVAPQVILAFASIAARVGRAGEAIDRLRAFIASDAPDHFRRQAEFRLGTLLDREGRYDDAFEAFQRGNDAVATSFSPQARDAMVTEIVRMWDRKSIARLAKMGSASVTPILILKMPRTGSTLVEQILSAHPAVSAAGERGTLGRTAASLGVDRADTHAAARLRRLTRDDVGRAAKLAERDLADAAGQARHITDSSLTNDRHAGLFAGLFPKAPVIICTRHPWDTCLSCYFQDFSGSLPWSHRLSHIAHYHRAHDRLLAHWQSVLPNPVHVVAYEALVSQPEASIRAMLDAVGLDWDDRCLAFQKNRRVAVTASNEQVTRPMYSSSVHRYRNYAAHIDELRRILPQSDD